MLSDSALSCCSECTGVARPGGEVGGSMFGSATDGERMYVAINNRPVRAHSTSVTFVSALLRATHW